MHLRNLETRDVPFMLEWMHDPKMTEFLNGRFAEKTPEDAEDFILHSRDGENLHLAIASDSEAFCTSFISSLSHCTTAPATKMLPSRA